MSLSPKGPGISLGGSGISQGEPLGLFGVSETLIFEVPQFVRTLRVRSISCRNLIEQPWPYNPQYSRIHIRSPNKGPRLLNQVPTLIGSLI